MQNMLMHIVMFKFKKSYSWDSPEAINAEMSTHSHPDNISEIKAWFCGRNIAHREIASDFVVIGLFEDSHALDAFIVHPDHQKGVAKWRHIADWTVTDVELGSELTLNGGLLTLLPDAATPY